MRLFLLRPIPEFGEGAWARTYDMAYGFVVRAENESAARVAAASEAGDEGAVAWGDGSQTTCCELLAGGEPGVVIRDFNAG